ncbi:hypothetical protein Ctha_1821 [Chloroherpeton thalassium ATCC 35110]|uniref:Uncharacterized protein n=1 Tax=Chloroherpeton thalassium (strain ATCC 35110 / GB-78) TaxID=517418 RepID=B3QTT0_CHLT3|nr:hypothetical protein [Chloroherpeton thalassium]ACF14278.1 hypothetical protein Ctha_1821 [Chloroherpeton thalassium ATCC 35110]
MSATQQNSPRWERLVKVEEIETETYFIDAYCSPISSAELKENHLDEKPILYAFAVFDRENHYVLSYGLEIREAYRVNENDDDEPYIGYFLETFCPNSQFSCKNYKEVEPDFESVKNTIMAYILEYDAVNKMLAYDKELLSKQEKGLTQDSEQGFCESNHHNDKKVH